MEATKPVRVGSVCAIAGMAMLLVLGSGCADFFAEKPTEIESQRIRDNIGDIRPVPDANAYVPYMFKAPPKIVEQKVAGKAQFKLLYFCKQHTSAELAAMIKNQFSEKTYDSKGNETVIPHYSVTTNPATNQLIIGCPTRDDVQAVLEILESMDVPPVQVRIDCLISEIYADKTLDWETTIQISDLLGEDISAGGSARLFGSDVLELIQEETPLPAFPGASLREVARAKMGLKIGYISAKHNFLAVVDLLESKGYLKIVMNPTLEVVNGKKAKIQSAEHVPLEQTFLRDREGFVESRVEYVDVIDSLEITPHVFADGYIGLETTALIGSKNIPEGVKQIRIVSKREIYNQENRIKQGQSLVIGGIRKSEEHSVIRGVPILKDIPGLNVLFSSKDFEERGIETMFILTPTISSGGIPNAEMVERLQRKHEPPPHPPTMEDFVYDPLGFEQRQQEYNQKIHEFDQQSYETAAARERARRSAEDAKEDAALAATDAEQARGEAQEAKDQAEQYKAESEKAKTEAKKLKKQAEAAEAKAKKAREDTAKAKEDATKAKAEAEQAKKEAAQAKIEADRAKQQADQAKAEAEKAKQEAQDTSAQDSKEDTEETTTVKTKTKEDAPEAKAEGDKAKQQAEQAKAKADKTKQETKDTSAQDSKEDTEEKTTAKANTKDQSDISVNVWASY